MSEEYTQRIYLRRPQPDTLHLRSCAVAGRPGLSAYEVAVAAGYEGTEAEWLASLKGADGQDGATGPQGPQGDPGIVELPLTPENGEDLAVCGTGVLHVDEDEISLSAGSAQTGQGAAYVGMLGVVVSYIPQGGSTGDEIAVTIDGNGIHCGDNQVHNVTAPTAGTDAANKNYVDGRVDSLIDTVNSWLAAIVGGAG